MMNITVKTVGQITVVEIYGSIDENTTPEAQAVILSRAQPGCKMALDLSQVSFLSSAGVRMLLMLHRTVMSEGGKFILVGLSEELKAAISASGLIDRFNLFADLDAGLGELIEVEAATTRGGLQPTPLASPPSPGPPPSLGPAHPPASRWLQAQLFEIQEGNQVRLERALRAGEQHRLLVRIGHTDEMWITAPIEDAFPEDKLPPGEDRYELRVVFWEPEHVPEPLVSAISLPRMSGNSSQCEFSFRAKAGVPKFEGHVLILHKGRCIQGMLLVAHVLSDPSQAPADARIVLKHDAFVQDPNRLEALQPVDVALFVANGGADLTVMSGDEARFHRVEGMSNYIKVILDELKQVADAPEDYGGLSAATTHLLQILARHGCLLYEEIGDQIGANNPVFDPHNTRLQLVSAVDSVLPLELVYTKASPYRQNAELCPNHKEALEKGECTLCSQLDPEAAAGTICPLGFLAMQRVIERQSARFAEPNLENADYVLQPESPSADYQFGSLGTAIYAASDRVGAAQIEELRKALEELTGQPVEPVANWAAWREAIQTRAPALLVLMPHTLEQDHLMLLEIGDGEQLPVDALRGPYVRASARYQPIVLLLGCETAAPDIPFQGFVQRFMRNGAALVLTTLTPIRGRHAVPVAKILLTELKHAAEKGQTFGDALLGMRRRALAAGLPMVLSLVAYGEVDWQLAP